MMSLCGVIVLAEEQKEALIREHFSFWLRHPFWLRLTFWLRLSLWLRPGGVLANGGGCSGGQTPPG